MNTNNASRYLENIQDGKDLGGDGGKTLDIGARSSRYDPQRRYESLLLRLRETKRRGEQVEHHQSSSAIGFEAKAIHVEFDSLWRVSTTLANTTKRIKPDMASAFSDFVFQERMTSSTTKVKNPSSLYIKPYNWGQLLGTKIDQKSKITDDLLSIYPECANYYECRSRQQVKDVDVSSLSSSHMAASSFPAPAQKKKTRSNKIKGSPLDAIVISSEDEGTKRKNTLPPQEQIQANAHREQSFQQPQLGMSEPSLQRQFAQPNRMRNSGPQFTSSTQNSVAENSREAWNQYEEGGTASHGLPAARSGVPSSNHSRRRLSPSSYEAPSNGMQNSVPPPPRFSNPYNAVSAVAKSVHSANNQFQTAQEFAKSGGCDAQPDQEEGLYDDAPQSNDRWQHNNNTRNNNNAYSRPDSGGNFQPSFPYSSSDQHQQQQYNDNSQPQQMHQPSQQGRFAPTAPIAGGPEISAGLKRKFQPPRRVNNSNGGPSSSNNNGGGSGTAVRRPQHANGGSSNSGSNEKDDDDELPEALQHLDKELVKKIQSEILVIGDPIKFDDIAGLEGAKQTIQELICWPMKRPDLFTGLRRAPNGLLLFGPPGTGKTLIGKAIAHESGATFFSISSSSLTSKWIGEGEKLVRTLFAVANYQEPAVVFIDEIDSLLTQRSSDENEASRRIKTEFLVQLDGTSGQASKGRVLIIGATNRPHELDDAARRRFVKRLYIPLPERADRQILLERLLRRNRHSLSPKEIFKLSSDTDGYSGADLSSLCQDASLGPVRQLGSQALEIAEEDLPPITYKHFKKALRNTKPSVAQDDLTVYLKWNATYGSKDVGNEDESSSDEDTE
jgi:SpoVK/Ycf46/Vps4 family AAA+-type ATPase